MKKYGLPYQGSKSKIAEKLGAMLPNADVFINRQNKGDNYSVVSFLFT